MKSHPYIINRVRCIGIPIKITLNPLPGNNDIGLPYQRFLYLPADPRHAPNISFCSTTAFEIETIGRVQLSSNQYSKSWKPTASSYS